MRRRGNDEKNNNNHKDDSWLTCPPDESIEMSSHPGPYIKEQEETP